MTAELWRAVRDGARLAYKTASVLAIPLDGGRMNYVVIRQQYHTSIYFMALLVKEDQPWWKNTFLLTAISWQWTAWSKSERLWNDYLTPETDALLCAAIERILPK